MATITVRRLDDAVVDAIKRRATEVGHSMEEEVRRTLIEAYGAADRAQLRRKAVARLRDPAVQALLPKGNGVDSIDIIREMREERDQQLMEATERHHGRDR